MSKRRRLMPKRKLKIMRYPKVSQKRPSRVPAARYGLFYDMMRKYMATKVIGQPSIAQKTMSLVLRRKNNIMSSKQMKMEGFRVSRFCLISYPGNGMNSTPQVYTDANYSVSGIVPTWDIRMRNFPPQGTLFPGSFDIHAQQWIPLTLVQTGVITIHPQWPGSKLFTWDAPSQGTSNLSKPEWGLLPGNQNNDNRNYNWNTKAVSNVKAFLQNVTGSSDNLEILYRTIKVFKSTLTMEFWNSSQVREMDVHIVHFRFVDIDTSNAGTCTPAENDYQLLHNLIAGEAGSTTSTYLVQNTSAAAFEYMLQRKKLPTKNYITKSWKTITLGKAVDPLIKISDLGTIVTRNMQPAVSQKCYRKITFKYGLKTWARPGCVQEGTFIDDSVLTDRHKLDTQVMVFCTFNKNYMNDSFTHVVPTTAAYDTTRSFVNFRMWKTNIWREQN